MAASASCVGISPAQAITTSGSTPWSLLAGPQILTPGAVRDRFIHRQVLKVRLLIADDYVDVVLAAQTMVGDNSELASGGKYIRVTSPRLFTTTSRKPGS